MKYHFFRFSDFLIVLFRIFRESDYLFVFFFCYDGHGLAIATYRGIS